MKVETRVGVLGIVSSGILALWGVFRFYQVYADIWPSNYVKYEMVPWHQEFQAQALRGTGIHIITNVGALIAALCLVFRLRHSRGAWLFFTTLVAMQQVYVVAVNHYYFRSMDFYKQEFPSAVDVAQLAVPLIVCAVSWTFLKSKRRATETPPNQAL